MPTVSLTYTAQLADLRKQLASIPEMTSAEARKAVAELNKVIKTASRGAEKANKVTQKASADTAQGLKRLGAAAGGKLGELGTRLEDLSTGFKALASPIGVASVGVAAVAAGVVVLTAAMLKAVLAADEFIEDLEGLKDLQGFELIDPEQVKAIETVNGALSALTAISKKVVILFAAEFGPALERIAVNLVAFGLAALDLFHLLGRASEVFDAFKRSITAGILQPVDMAVEALVGLATVVAAIAKAVGAAGLAADLNVAVGAWKGLRDELGEVAITGFDVVDLFGDYTGRAQELIELLPVLTTEQENVTDATREQAEAQGEVNGKLAETIRLLHQVTEAQQQGASDGKLTTALQLAELEQQQADYEAAQAAIVNAGTASATALIGLAQSVTDGKMAGYDTETAAGREAALKMFKIQKGLAFTQVQVNAAAGVMKSIATLGPPVPPNVAGIAGMAAVAVGHVTATAGVLATKPPEFPSGGVVRGMSTDHFPVGVQNDEAILNRAAVQNLGDSGVDALNNGEGAPPMSVMVVQPSEHVFDPFIQDTLNRGGPLADAIRSASRRGPGLGGPRVRR